MNPRPSAPITAKEVLGWFEAAKVRGATLEAAEYFAALSERRRGPKDGDAHADARALSELVNASHGFLRLLLTLPAYLQRLPEVRALALALRPVVAFPPSARGRPTDDGTRAAADFMVALETVLPQRTSKRARLEIVQRALRACGWGAEKNISNIQRADRRRRAKTKRT
jgi:hypothetical protein